MKVVPTTKLSVGRNATVASEGSSSEVRTFARNVKFLLVFSGSCISNNQSFIATVQQSVGMQR